jgi:hypothetical protein
MCAKVMKSFIYATLFSPMKHRCDAPFVGVALIVCHSQYTQLQFPDLAASLWFKSGCFSIL